jgi:hypothetical protein
MMATVDSFEQSAARRNEELRLEAEEILKRREGTTGERFEKLSDELFAVHRKMRHDAAVYLRAIFD